MVTQINDNEKNERQSPVFWNHTNMQTNDILFAVFVVRLTNGNDGTGPIQLYAHCTRHYGNGMEWKWKWNGMEMEKTFIWRSQHYKNIT